MHRWHQRSRRGWCTAAACAAHVMAFAAIAEPSDTKSNRDAAYEIRAFVQQLDSGERVATKDDFDRLFRACDNGGVDDRTRGRAFKHALEIASGPAYDAIHQFLQTREPFARSVSNEEATVTSRFTREYLSAFPRIVSSMTPDQKAAACEIVATYYLYPELMKKVSGAVAACPEEDRALAILAIARTSYYTFPARLAAFVDEDLYARLRAQAIKDLDTGNADACGIRFVAERGEVQLLSRLEREREKTDNANMKEYLTETIWRIEVQREPNGLTSYLRNTPITELGSYRGRFALERAIESGVPKAQIRAALQVQLGKADLNDRSEYNALRRLKHIAVEKGVMTSEDMPGIKAIVVQLPACEG